MPLASCAGVNLADLPAPLKVDQPQACEDVLAPIEVPEDRSEDDAIGAYLANRLALINAADEVDAGRACLRDQRAGYAGKGISQ